jgi:RNA polymerase sigma-70 factor (ECF subfamily)
MRSASVVALHDCSSASSETVARNLKNARAAWPDVRISDERFFAFVAERLVTDGVLDVDLVDRYATDLFLACACAQGDSVAIAIVEEQYFSAEVDAPCRRSGVITPEEMRQRVRTKLFVGPEPRIASYAGRSSLRAWLRAVIGRLVIDVSRERPRDVPTPDGDFSGVIATGDDPDLRLVKQTYQEALEVAFVHAADRLSPRDKNILRYGLAEGLNIDQIGAIYGVHRVTAHRWLQQARASFADQIRAVMMERLKMSPSEYGSVVRLVMSQFDVTIARVFAGNSGKETA